MDRENAGMLEMSSKLTRTLLQYCVMLKIRVFIIFNVWPTLKLQSL